DRRDGHLPRGGSLAIPRAPGPGGLLLCTRRRRCAKDRVSKRGSLLGRLSTPRAVASVGTLERCPRLCHAGDICLAGTPCFMGRSRLRSPDGTPASWRGNRSLAHRRVLADDRILHRSTPYGDDRAGRSWLVLAQRRSPGVAGTSPRLSCSAYQPL